MVGGVSGIGGPIVPINQPLNQPVKGGDKTSSSTASGVNFQNFFGLIKSPEGNLVVPGSNNAGQSDFNRSKLDIEQARKFQTDMEKAQELLYQISQTFQKKKKE